jgi:hypothetical protein
MATPTPKATPKATPTPMPSLTPGVKPSITPAPTQTPGGYGNNSGGVTTSPGSTPPPGVQYLWPDNKGGKTPLTAKQYVDLVTTNLNQQKQAYDLMVKARVLTKSQTKTDAIVTAWQKAGLEAARNGTDVITYLQQRASTFGSAATGSTKVTTGKYAIDMQGNKVPTTQLTNQYLSIGPDVQNQVVQLTTQLGKKPSQASTVWAQAVKDSAAFVDKGIYMSPLQVLQKQISERTTAPITYTNTDQTTYDTSVQGPVINQVYKNLIGRLATSDEINSIVNQASAQKQISKTTYVTGGVNRQVNEVQTPQQIAQNQLLTSPTYQPELTRMKDINFSSWLAQAMSSGPAAAGGLANG